MKEWTKQKLIDAGYEIENAHIMSADLSMANHGCLTLEICIRGSCWGASFGGYSMGNGYVGAEEFIGDGNGLESVMRIMDVVGVERFNSLKGKYIRIAQDSNSGPIEIIGNILNDHWFDIKSFYEDKRRDKNKD